MLVSLVRVALTIVFAVVSVGAGWAMQSDDRVHEIAEKALSIIRKMDTVAYQELSVALLLAENVRVKGVRGH